MGFRVVSIFFFLIGVACLPFWPYTADWPAMAELGICGFCFFLACLTLVLSFTARHGSPVWKGRGHG